MKGDSFILKINEARSGEIKVSLIKDHFPVSISDSKSIKNIIKVISKIELAFNMVTLILTEVDFTP